MVKRGRKRIINIPKAEELNPIKEVQELEKKKEEEVKKKEEELKRQKEEEIKKQEDKEKKEIRKQEDAHSQEVKKEELELQERLIEEIKKEVLVDDIEGFERKQNEDDTDHDGIIIKYYSDKPDEFLYKTEPSNFQKNLKEFFKDLPDMEESESEPKPVEKIELLTNKIEKAETVQDFNTQVKQYMKDRNKNATPQAYKDSSSMQVNIITKEDDQINDKKLHILQNTVIQNTKIASCRRGNAPISRVTKVSGRRMV